MYLHTNFVHVFAFVYADTYEYFDIHISTSKYALPLICKSRTDLAAERSLKKNHPGYMTFISALDTFSALSKIGQFAAIKFGDSIGVQFSGTRPSDIVTLSRLVVLVA
jgi:hypothetical protein